MPDAVAVSPDGSKLYVVNDASYSVSVIDTASNTVTATIPVGAFPEGVAVSPDGSKVYVANDEDGTVSVIETASNTVIATIPVGYWPFEVAVSPDSSKVYVTNDVDDSYSGRVSVIDTASNTVTATIPVGVLGVNGLGEVIGGALYGVAVSPDGSKVYVTNAESNTVSVIATASNTVTATIPVGTGPLAFGVFIPIPVPQTAPVAGNRCNGIYNGAFSGNLTVSAGQDCIFLNGKITGNVIVVGGNFALNNSAVSGNVMVNGGGTYTLGPAATVGGNLLIQNRPAGSVNNSVCGATIYGNVELHKDGTAVQLGSTAPLFCAGNTIGGNFEVVHNTNSALMFDNSVGGNMSVLDNISPVDVVGNTVRGNLLCQGNTNLVMGSGNTASKKRGECN